MNFFGPNRGRLLYSQTTDALLQPNPPASMKSQGFFLVLEMSKNFARMPGIIPVYFRGYKYGLRSFVRTERKTIKVMLHGTISNDVFLSQNSVAMLEECCNYSKQCCNDVPH